MNINFLDRSKVVLRTDNTYLAVSVREAKEKLQDASLSSDTFTFDNTITQKQDLETRWLIPVKDAWFAK